ncbi:MULTISPECIES: response regulator transcription factor [Pseudomonas]|uniref:Response regulator transcription factor n=1 Tax=Pseudomonas lactis TaxID=1615674 RepID=A0A7Y1Q7R0_9PSED|nr:MULTISPECIES: response regulator transcription factor [Pseudomonas]KRP82277.1 LuxR family transcriptional regulator [Pseudomonas lactis]MDI3252380.1 response regulator transcription factor [Pseudomonas sp. AL10]MDI3268254.1 response regulator transcription factor [Pseudomonas sp. AL15]NNA71250.1 response regulator transcription factor [Pseudomonas lactis]NNA80231.1 response regulator transcription factor [Pseudomonas lactis]
MLKAMIVDDHPFIRSAVRMILKQEQYEIVAEADNGADAVRLTREHQPNLIVLDITMPGVDGLIALNRISDLKLPVKVLVLTSLSAVFFSMRCMRAGAAGYVSKAEDLDELAKAINAIKSGFTFFPDLTMNSVRRKDVDASEQALIQSLSDRELSILQLLAKGLSNKQIGEQMILSNKTISTYKARIVEKLNLSSLVHLADLAKRNNLI